MKKSLIATLLIGVTVLPALQGCFPVVAAGVTTGVMATVDRRTLGVPVIAVGVPLVVYASTIASDALCALGEGEVEEERIAACVERVVSEKLGEMIVTPRNIDSEVVAEARLVAYAVNCALHEGLKIEDIDMLVG